MFKNEAINTIVTALETCGEFVLAKHYSEVWRQNRHNVNADEIPVWQEENIRRKANAEKKLCDARRLMLSANQKAIKAGVEPVFSIDENTSPWEIQNECFIQVQRFFLNRENKE